MSIDFNGLSASTVTAHVRDLIEIEMQRIREDNEANPKGRQLELDESQAYLTALRFVESMAIAVSDETMQAVWNVVKERKFDPRELEKYHEEVDLFRHRVFYRQKETNSARHLDECESTGFTMTVEMDRRAECQCHGTDLKLLGNFDYRGEILSAGIVYKEYRDGPEDFYNPPEWRGIDWRTTDYRMKNPDVLLDGAINGLMKQLMAYLYKSDFKKEEK